MLGIRMCGDPRGNAMCEAEGGASLAWVSRQAQEEDGNTVADNTYVQYNASGKFFADQMCHYASKIRKPAGLHI
jgi:hypothetical protein